MRAAGTLLAALLLCAAAPDAAAQVSEGQILVSDRLGDTLIRIDPVTGDQTPLDLGGSVNSPFVRSSAEGLAKRAQAAAGNGTPEQLLDTVTTIAVCRPASNAERDNLLPLLASLQAEAGADAGKRAAALVDICQLVLSTNEFIYVD